MKTYWPRGQAVWFAFGSWASISFLALLDMIRERDKMYSVRDDNGFGLMPMLIVNLSVAGLLAIPYFAWLEYRGRRRIARWQAPWPFPLIAGLLFPLLVGGAIAALIAIGAPNRVIGTMVLVGFFGLPIGFAEVCWRIGEPVSMAKASCPASEPESFDFTDPT